MSDQEVGLCERKGDERHSTFNLLLSNDTKGLKCVPAPHTDMGLGVSGGERKETVTGVFGPATCPVAMTGSLLCKAML